MRIRNYTVVIGVEQQILAAPEEDTTYNFTFINPDGTPINLTGAINITFTVKDWQGLLQFGGGRVGTVTSPSLGQAQFIVTETDLAITSQPYECDIYWTNNLNQRVQLLPGSPFIVLPAVSDTHDPLTTPPSIPVIYGLRWLGNWSSSVTYQINDAVQYPDPNGGLSFSLSSFRAKVVNLNVPPLNNLGQLSVDWEYIAERGFDGANSGTIKGCIFRYTVQPTDGQDFFITLPQNIPVDYIVYSQLLPDAPVDAELFAPLADRSSTQFRALLSSLCIGGTFEITVLPLSNPNAVFVFPASAYTIIKNASGTPQVQRTNLKFGSDFSVADANPDTTVSLANVGPGAGTIGSPGNMIQSVTLDAKGRVTAAVAVAAGGGGGVQANALFFSPCETALDSGLMTTGPGPVTFGSKWKALKALTLMGLRFTHTDVGSTLSELGRAWWGGSSHANGTVNASSGGIYMITFSSPVSVPRGQLFFVTVFNASNYSTISLANWNNQGPPALPDTVGPSLILVSANNWNAADAQPNSSAVSEIYPVEPIFTVP